MHFRKHFLLLIPLLILELNTEASVWSKTFDGVRGDSGQSASPTSDGGVILSGTTKGGYEGYLMKINSTGNIQWQKLFGRPGINMGVLFHDSIQASDGGYVAVGAAHAAVAGTSDLFIVKTNSQGVKEWMRIYSIPGDEIGYRIRQTRDRGFIIAGYSFPSRNEADILLVRVDAQGTILWQKILEYGYEDFSDLQTTSDGNFILAASTTFVGQDAFVMKFDDSGKTLWSRTYGGSGADGALGIQQTRDGGYVVCGWTQQINNTLDLWVFKLSPSGKIQWQYLYGGSNNDTGWGVALGRDDTFFVTGFTLSFGAGKEDVWLLKLSSTGQVLFEKTYGGPKGDWPTSIRSSRDGGMFVTGLDQLPSRIQQTAFVLKLNSSGELNNCSRLTLADSKAVVRGTTASATDVLFNVTDATLTELPTDQVRITNGTMKSITDCNLITGINPSAVAPGSVIELTGIGFGNSQADSKLFIGKRDTGKAISWSDNKIVSRLPRDARTAGLILQNNLGRTVPIELPILPPAGKKCGL